MKSCRKCKGPCRNDSKSGLCRKCWKNKDLVKSICPICKEKKSYGAKTCLKCFDIATRRQSVRNVASLFSKLAGKEYERIILRAGWTVDEICSITKIPKQTIKLWIQGVHYPRKVELGILLKILAFVPCECCKGLGYVDPEANQSGSSYSTAN